MQSIAIRDRRLAYKSILGGPPMSKHNSMVFILGSLLVLTILGASDEPKDADAYCKRGDSWLEKREYDKAIADYTEALRLDPKLVKAYYNRAVAWSEKADYDRAIADFTEALRLEPDKPDTLNGRGTAWFKKGDFDKSIGDYTEALRFDPKYFEAHHNLSMAWFRKGDYDRTIDETTQALSLRPDDDYMHWRRGEARFHKRDYVRAIADYSSSRANAWLDDGHPDKAIADFIEVLRLDPNGAEAYAGRATAWIRTREPGASLGPRAHDGSR